MSETAVVIAGVSAVAVIIIAVIAVVIFAVTRHGAVYRSFKKPVRTMGIVDGVEYVEPHINGGEPHYIISYYYTDSAGNRHTARFAWQKKAFGVGDKIALHFDSQNPENCIADCQLKYGKSMWWKALLIIAAIVVPSFVIAFLFAD